MSNLPVIQDEMHETKDAKRKRLAIELRAIHQQQNSKLLELLDTGVDVIIATNGNTKLANEDALIGSSEISYQTAPKHY